MQTRHSSKLTTDLTNAQSSCGWSLLQYCGLCPIAMIHGRLARFSFAFCNYHNNEFSTITKCYGLFTLPDLDLDSDCQLNGLTVPCRTFYTARSWIEIPNTTATYRNGVGMGIRIRIRICECK